VLASKEVQINKILLGDSRQLLKQLPDSRYSLLFTSPPYALSIREYTKDDPDEIGRENSITEYLDALIQVANEAKRVLYPWACQVWNIGDRFKDKRQLKIPQKFSDRMEEIGYYQFDETIWYKGNGSPTSAPTHFRPDFEKVLFFAREDQDRYFFDLNATRVPLADVTVKRDEYALGALNPMGNGMNSRHSKEKVKFDIMPKVGGSKHAGNNSNATYSGNNVKSRDGKANLGSVWEISPQLERFALEYCPECHELRDKDHMWKRCGKCHQYRFENDEQCPICKKNTNHEMICTECNKNIHSHYAQFPLELARRVVKSCSPEYVCSQCGTPRMPTYNITRIDTRPGNDTNNGRGGSVSDPNGGLHSSEWSKKRQTSIAESTGFESQCSCNAAFEAGVVLDPFMGWGTTAVVCLENGRNFLGCDINRYNIEAAIKRLEWVDKEKNIPFTNQSRLF